MMFQVLKCCRISSLPLRRSFRRLCSGNSGFIETEDGFVIVYTDGACINNGKDYAKAGIGVWFNHDHPLNAWAPAEGVATCNNAEIQAARLAVDRALGAGVTKLLIHTDSKFTIDCMTRWIFNWKRNDWKLAAGGAVKNAEELKRLDAAVRKMEQVKWNHVPGHRGSVGNEMADALAKKGAQFYKNDKYLM